MNEIVYILLAAGLIFFGGSTLAAFYWAAKTGQFRNLEDGSKSIFDGDEPVGAATDSFSDKQPDRPLRRGAIAARP